MAQETSIGTIELRTYKWQEKGENYRADYFVYVDGRPRPDITCEKCTHYRGPNTDCHKAVEVGPQGDDRLYPWCGPVCGYFQFNG